jgi:hypothetical protein
MHGLATRPPGDGDDAELGAGPNLVAGRSSVGLSHKAEDRDRSEREAALGGLVNRTLPPHQQHHE